MNIISGAFAALPLGVYEHVRKEGREGKKRAFNHPLWETLRECPNIEMTSHSWLKTMMVHDLLWANAFTEIERNNANQIINLWPRNPAKTRAIRTLQPFKLEGTDYPAGTLVYETSESLMDNSDVSATDNANYNLNGHRRIVLAEDMLHVPGLSLDGRVGQSTVWLTREAFGLALAAEKYAAKFFGNGARPAGILEIPNAMEDKAIENLRRSWAEAHGGENQFKVAVLEQGIKFQKIAATPEEGQMLQTRQQQRAEICSIFNVPLHMVSGNEKAGKSNIEQSSIEFVMYCLQPWIVAWEQELKRKLFPKMGRTANMHGAYFDTRRLLYPDAASRATFYGSGRQWGYLTKNDICELEGMNPVEDGTGDTYMVQVNMMNDKGLLPGGSGDGKKPPVPKSLPAPKAEPTDAVPVKSAPKAKGKRSDGTDEEEEIPVNGTQP